VDPCRGLKGGDGYWSIQLGRSVVFRLEAGGLCAERDCDNSEPAAEVLLQRGIHEIVTNTALR
jgi:hypothetical protein